MHAIWSVVSARSKIFEVVEPDDTADDVGESLILRNQKIKLYFFFFFFSCVDETAGFWIVVLQVFVVILIFIVCTVPSRIFK